MYFSGPRVSSSTCLRPPPSFSAPRLRRFIHHLRYTFSHSPSDPHPTPTHPPQLPYPPTSNHVLTLPVTPPSQSTLPSQLSEAVNLLVKSYPYHQVIEVLYSLPAKDLIEAESKFERRRIVGKRKKVNIHSHLPAPPHPLLQLLLRARRVGQGDHLEILEERVKSLLLDLNHVNLQLDR